MSFNSSDKKQQEAEMDYSGDGKSKECDYVRS